MSHSNLISNKGINCVVNLCESCDCTSDSVHVGIQLKCLSFLPRTGEVLVAVRYQCLGCEFQFFF